MIRSISGLATAGLLVLALAGCGAPVPAETSASPTPSETATPTPEPVEYAPLTGEIVEVGSLTHASIAAKIDNHEDARPQIGLNQADIVFEELVEGGLTRYVAIWHSEIPKLYGPIRSIRPMDPDIVSPFGGIITYSGGQQKFVTMMKDTVVRNIIHGSTGTGDLMYRITDKIAPHNVVVKGQQLIAENTDLAAPLPALSFASNWATASTAGTGIVSPGFTVRIGEPSVPSWKWSGKNMAWVRFQTGGARDMDSAGAQLRATNVIVQRVKETHEYGYVPRANVVGTGDAWIFTGGKYLEATWTKADRASYTVYTDKATGEPILLAPGNTWIELMPNEGKLTIRTP